MSPELSQFYGKTVLITGGLGFIGSNLAAKLVQLGAKVTVYDCLDPRSGGNMHNISEFRKDITVILNDIRNLDGLSSAVLDKEFVFNCAAYTSHPNSMKEPYVDVEVNCQGVLNLLEATRRFSPEARIIHIGTSTQIGRMVYSPIDENHPEFPVDVYSANKSVGEKYVIIYGKVYNMKTTVVRLANNFGPRSNISSPDFGFVNYFVGLALQGKDITVYGDGEQLRSMTFIDDSVNAMLYAALGEQVNGEVFFAVSGKQYSVKEIAENISSIIGGQVIYVPWPKNRALIDVGDAIISSSKIEKALDWQADTSLSTGLEITKDYFKDCKDNYINMKKW